MILRGGDTRTKKSSSTIAALKSSQLTGIYIHYDVCTNFIVIMCLFFDKITPRQPYKS